MLNKKIHKIHKYGYVRLIDVMGNEEAIVVAARVSYGNDKKKTRDQNNRLLTYLYKNQHTSPFEMAVLKFQIKAPIFVARQWVRHRMASWNELSGRYSQMKPEFYVPDYFYGQAIDNKQKSSGKVVVDSPRKHLKPFYEQCYAFYEDLLAKGVSKEQARIVLPLSLYTTWVWKIDLHNLLHFLKLRTADNSQIEIREYAKVILNKVIKVYFPTTYKLFNE